VDKNVKLNIIYLNPHNPCLIRCFFTIVIIINLDFRDMFGHYFMINVYRDSGKARVISNSSNITTRRESGWIFSSSIIIRSSFLPSIIQKSSRVGRHRTLPSKQIKLSHPPITNIRRLPSIVIKSGSGIDLVKELGLWFHGSIWVNLEKLKKIKILIFHMKKSM
jgi:hypothetical protein